MGRAVWPIEDTQSDGGQLGGSFSKMAWSPLPSPSHSQIIGSVELQLLCCEPSAEEPGQ